MNEALVLGAVLRIDVCGWTGPPPSLPGAPVRVDAQASGGAQSFVYDLMPRHACVSAPAACERLGALIESLLENWPFRDLAFPARCRLDVGLLAEEPSAAWRIDWPVAFLAALAEAEIELCLSCYPSNPET